MMSHCFFSIHISSVGFVSGLDPLGRSEFRGLGCWGGLDSSIRSLQILLGENHGGLIGLVGGPVIFCRFFFEEKMAPRDMFFLIWDPGGIVFFGAAPCQQQSWVVGLI